MGVLELNIVADVSCEGFVGYDLLDWSPPEGVMGSYADFVTCQSLDSYDHMCMFIDTSASKLYLYSNPSREFDAPSEF